MKIIVLVILSLLTINTVESFSQRGAIVEGTIEDSNGEYVILNYTPRFRGNLNFDGFRSIGSFVDDHGKFKLQSNRITNAANYNLEILDKGINLVLMEGDRITLTFSLDDINNVFATGQGAGKINVLKLRQFQYDYFDLEKTRTLSQFVDYLDSVNVVKNNLLDVIFEKNQDHKLLTESLNSSKIRRIINSTPLNKDEYSFLKSIVIAQRFNMLNSFLTKPQKEGTIEEKIEAYIYTLT